MLKNKQYWENVFLGFIECSEVAVMSLVESAVLAEIEVDRRTCQI
jgi:hypothetical protein